jgi:hypothetical protein
MIAVHMLQPLVVQGLLSEQSMWLWRDLRSQAAELCHFIIESSAQLVLEGPCSPCLQNVSAFAQALTQSPQDIISVLSDWRLVLLSLRLAQFVFSAYLHLSFLIPSSGTCAAVPVNWVCLRLNGMPTAIEEPCMRSMPTIFVSKKATISVPLLLVSACERSPESPPLRHFLQFLVCPSID